MVRTMAEKVAEFGVRVGREGLPSELRLATSERIVDLVGNCLGALVTEPARIVTTVASAWGGVQSATAIGSAVRLPAPSAALVNGTLAHTLDFDDTHLPSILHPSAAVVPAALAVAEQTEASPNALLDAATVGVEITCRLGMTGYDRVARDSVFFDRGQHATAICGAVGAAVAAGMLYGLSANQLVSAIGIACSMGAGVMEANRTGGTVKRIHCGWAAHSGVVAAEMARHGITGPPTALEGRFGFLQAFLGEKADLKYLTLRLGEHWESQEVFFKLYPCNHFTHPGIDAAVKIRKSGINIRNISSITLGLPRPAMRTIAQPAAEKASPRSGYHAAFSGPYTVASALVGNDGLGVSHEDFTDIAALDPVRLKIAGMVTCVEDAESTAVFPTRFPAVLTVETTDGTRITERIDSNRGGPGNRLNQAEIAQKFASNATRVVTPEVCERIMESAWELAHGGQVQALTDHLGRVQVGATRW